MLVMFVCVVPTCLLRSTTACVFRTAMQFGTLARPPQRPSTLGPSFASVSRSVLASMVVHTPEVLHRSVAAARKSS